MCRSSTFLFFLIVQLNAIQAVFSQKSDVSERFVYPSINKYGKALSDFSPKNWEITDTISGDLNKDGANDFALVLGYRDSIKISDGYKFPRILLIVFKVGDQYELKLQHNTLLEFEKTEGCGCTIDDPGSIEIYNGVLKLHFKWNIRGAGTLIQYAVRYQSNDFYLIGATCTSGYRASKSISDFNFSMGRYIYDETDDEAGFGGKYSKKHKKGKLPTRTLKKITEIKRSEYWSLSDFIH
jgi:hypothetical protein